MLFLTLYIIMEISCSGWLPSVVSLAIGESSSYDELLLRLVTRNPRSRTRSTLRTSDGQQKCRTV